MPGSCWREVVDGTPGLYICLTSGAPTIHIDVHQTIRGTITGVNVFGLNPFNDNPLLVPIVPRTCFYDLLAVLDHFNDLSGSGDESIFMRIGRQRDRLRSLRGEYAGHTPDEQSRYLAQVPSDLDGAEGKPNAIEPALRRFAVEGFNGEEDAANTPNVVQTASEVDDTIQSVRKLLDGIPRSDTTQDLTPEPGGPM